MPPFQYTNDRNPYIGSIGELMLRRGDIEAQRATQVANATARASEVSGQAWGNAVSNAGNAVSGAVQQMNDPRRQLEQVQLDEAKRGQRARSALGQIVSSTPHVDEDGVSLYDVPTITKQLEAQGFGDHVGDVATQLKGLNDSFRSERAAKLATVTRGAQALLQANADPDLTLNFIDQLEKNGSWPKGQLDYFRQVISKDPTKTGQILQQFAGPAKLGTAAPGSTIYNEGTGQTVATVPDKPEKPTEASLAATANDPAKSPEERAAAKAALESLQAPTMAGRDETARHNTEMERISKLTAGREAAAQQETARHNRVTEGEGDNAVALTPEGLDAAATLFAKTGTLPPMGMGKQAAAARTKIINRAAVLMPGLDIASAKADFEANKSSLKNVTGTLDTLTAFENTSGKNLDMFLKAAEKIPDTGVPWLNTPVRLLNRQLVGSENQAAADAARTVALREIARVTNDPKLSGVLSDSARQEVLSLSPENATFAQIKHVAQLLKQDMANVHSSLSAQRDAIGGRISKASASTPATPGSSEPIKVGAFTVTVK